MIVMHFFFHYFFHKENVKLLMKLINTLMCGPLRDHSTSVVNIEAVFIRDKIKFVFFWAVSHVISVQIFCKKTRNNKCYTNIYTWVS